MTCPNCSKETPADSHFCPHCGNQLHQTSAASALQEPGRGGLIFGFGLTSILLLGPILGIPAWVMGRTDLSKIKDGFIAASEYTLTKAGMIMGIVGTFVSAFTIIIVGIAIAIGLSLFSAQAIQANRDAMVQDMSSIAAEAYQYYLTHDQSYDGFELSSRARESENGTYSAFLVGEGMLKIVAISSMRKENGITAHVDGRGRLGEWEYFGDFQ